MKQIITFDKEEFDNKFLEFVSNFKGFMEEGYGFRMYERTGTENKNPIEIKNINQIAGNLHTIWLKTFQVN